MRYYSIQITDSNGALITRPSSVPGSGATYSSLLNGLTIPGALNVELDIPVYAYATPAGQAIVRIWGISLAEISQASDFGATSTGPGKNIAVYAGMQRGLPLANPAQAGLIVQGEIFQAFGNWIGVDQTLDLILYPATGAPDDPKNFVVNWKAGTPLSQAIDNTLSVAFPSLKRNIQISPNLVLAHDEPGFYGSLTEFAQWVKQVSADIKVQPNYQGVDITVNQNMILVYDGTTPSTPKLIAFQDLIGQPTWIESPSIQFKTVMRADLAIGDFVQLPPAVVTTTSAAASSLLNLKAAFQGVFQITDIHHFGNYRQPDADSWVTVFTAFPTTLSGA
jgi:hypothetical protein